MANTVDEKEILISCLEEIKSHYSATNIDIIKEIDGEFAEALSDLKLEDIELGEKPKFRKYNFSGVLFAAAMADMDYYDWNERTTKKKTKTFSYLNAHPFNGKYWIMENEDNSDISLCRNMREKALNAFDKEEIKKYENFQFFSLSEKESAAIKVAWRVADDFIFFSTAHLPTRGYVKEGFVKVNENFKCLPDASSLTVSVDVIPVFIKLKNGKRLFAGAYLPDEQRTVIYLYDEKIKAKEKEITENKIRAESEKRKKRNKIIIIVAVCALVVAAIVGINVAALTGALA